MFLPDPDTARREARIEAVARDLARTRTWCEADRVRLWDTYDDEIAALGDDGRALLVHWLDVYWPLRRP